MAPFFRMPIFSFGASIVCIFSLNLNMNYWGDEFCYSMKRKRWEENASVSFLFVWKEEVRIFPFYCFNIIIFRLISVPSLRSWTLNILANDLSLRFLEHSIKIQRLVSGRSNCVHLCDCSGSWKLIEKYFEE